jgi:hypothetical protein
MPPVELLEELLELEELELLDELELELDLPELEEELLEELELELEALPELEEEELELDELAGSPPQALKQASTAISDRGFRYVIEVS